MNSYNPVFVTVGLRMGADTFYQSMKQFGLLNRTGIDVPGEAGTIMHAQDQIGPVELATISFGQSFQITPIQLAATVSSLINGGTRITPHLGLYCEKTDGSERISVQKETEQKRILSEETSARLRSILFQVVENGGGKKWKSRRLSGGRQDGDQRDALAVLVGIFLRFWVLHLRTIRRCWHCALSETPQASIMADWWRRR